METIAAGLGLGSGTKPNPCAVRLILFMISRCALLYTGSVNVSNRIGGVGG